MLQQRSFLMVMRRCNHRSTPPPHRLGEAAARSDHVGDVAPLFAFRGAATCGTPGATGTAPQPTAIKRPRPMLSPERRESLEKMYNLVGTHSAVKLCRWQKSMMRGRGGCYKWTFYGIKSHQCMEATPSLGCANKCTFCWRLNSNPTIKEWKYDVDEPVELVGNMIKAHQGLVKNAKGIAGCLPDRYEEAMMPKHCALSLVGEPIIYPRINEFVDELHRKGVSTFLVNNGQFPEAIKNLKPITQLYLSVDAADRDTLKELDRPAFADFWERMQQSVLYMREKPARTVFRLTLIEGYNMRPEDVKNFATIILQGNPHFVEMKQLTPAFNGSKEKTPLRIANVPSWERIVEFGTALAEEIKQQLLTRSTGGQTGPEGREASDKQQQQQHGYSVACCHEHSSCLLLARDDFRINGKWHTWIDFDRFNQLVLSHQQQLNGGSPSPSPSPVIDAKDYLLETPEWAVFGRPEGGFDPKQTRWYSNRAKKHMMGPHPAPTESAAPTTTPTATARAAE